MLFKKKKETLQNKDTNADVSESQNGYRLYRKEYFIEERSDATFEMNKITSPIIYKYTIFTLIVSLICILATVLHLIIRDDTRFYATSPDGRVWELRTRETPNGSFKIDYHHSIKAIVPPEKRVGS